MKEDLDVNEKTGRREDGEDGEDGLGRGRRVRTGQDGEDGKTGRREDGKTGRREDGEDGEDGKMGRQEDRAIGVFIISELGLVSPVCSIQPFRRPLCALAKLCVSPKESPTMSVGAAQAAFGAIGYVCNPLHAIVAGRARPGERDDSLIVCLPACARTVAHSGVL